MSFCGCDKGLEFGEGIARKCGADARREAGTIMCRDSDEILVCLLDRLSHQAVFLPQPLKLCRLGFGLVCVGVAPADDFITFIIYASPIPQLSW